MDDIGMFSPDDQLLTGVIDLDGGEADASAWSVDLDHSHLAAAINEAASRAHYDPSIDVLTPAFVNDVQGIAAEYLVADALNETHDGLEYRLFTDPSHPDVDIAGVDVNGNIIRLLQVKATGSTWYAHNALGSGLEVITSADSWSDGMLRYDMSSAELRAMVMAQLAK